MITDTSLGAGREFDLIRDLCRRWGPRAVGIGDDAAVLASPGEPLVATVDTLIENRHFKREWLSAREIGYRAAVAAISDIAAMAASPLGMLVALAFPPDWIPLLAQLGDGIGEAAGRFEVPIIGGNISTGGELAITITVLGSAPAPIRRSGAQPGAAIYVTGRLGGPGAAVSAWLAGAEPAPTHRERFVHPVPRLREARWLAEHGAMAMIDVSDGLIGDLGHLAAASDLRIAVELSGLLVVAGVTPEEAARSGEEYELALAAPHDLSVEQFTREFALPISRVGRVVAGPPGVDVFLNGERVASGGGFSHF